MKIEDLLPYEIEALLVVRRALQHQLLAHGATPAAGPRYTSPAVMVSDTLCPSGALLIVGTDVWSRLEEIRTEVKVVIKGVDEASSIIQQIKKG